MAKRVTIPVLRRDDLLKFIADQNKKHNGKIISQKDFTEFLHDETYWLVQKENGDYSG